MHKVTIDENYHPVALAQANLEIRRVYKCGGKSLIFYKRLGAKYYFLDYRTLEQHTFHGADVVTETEFHLNEIIIKRGDL